MSGRILIVDDEEAFRRLCGRWLESAGHQVSAAADPAAALALFARGGLDLVLLDLVMPPSHTPEAGLELIAQFRPLPVIVLTGHAQHELALRAIDAGAWDFLGKPVDPDLLRFVIARALDRSTLLRELAELRERAGVDDFGLIGRSPAIAGLRDLIRRIGPSDLSVMILGPSGTGKELVARGLHAASKRKGAPFVAVHCGAIPAELLESELFGHLKGSFTGADRDRPGLVQAAHGGVLFLDEIGEMPGPMQVKLLRFMQDGTFLPVGGRTPLKADVRVVSATHRELPAMVADGSFREDLFYRLKGLIMRTPPLSERREDIGLLAEIFLRRCANGRALRFTNDATSWLVAQDWPGNVRELQSFVQTCVALAEPAVTTIGRDVIELAATGQLKAGPAAADSSDETLPAQVASLEKRLIVSALEKSDGNHSQAARTLGVSRLGLVKKMSRLGLREPD
jgi:two-component system NtrC family response regulator